MSTTVSVAFFVVAVLIVLTPADVTAPVVEVAWAVIEVDVVELLTSDFEEPHEVTNISVIIIKDIEIADLICRFFIKRPPTFFE